MRPITESTFGDLLRRYRTEAGLTQEELAERAGLSARAISDLERGVNRYPYRTTVQSLIQVLGLQAEDAEALLSSVQRRRGRMPELARPRSTIPTPPTLMLGRERELGQVLHLLRWEGIRFVTLTGPGGVGKTRLALEIARELETDFLDGCTLVCLEDMAGAELVPSAVAGALGVRASAGSSIEEALLGSLRERELFVVLDNFEHVLPAGILVSRLLSGCPKLKVLVTSREPLHLRGEQEIDVSPLSVPESGRLPPLEELRRVPSVTLFLRRACAVRSGFELSGGNANGIVEICRMLDGLPLAIELAAARVKALSPFAIAERLRAQEPGETTLDLTSSGPRDLPARQHSMRLAVAWSYDLLPEKLRALFRRLSVFVGGFTLEAAGAVCAGDGVPETEVMESLISLLDASMIVRTEPIEDEPEFRLLEPLRQFGREQLVASGEQVQARSRHAAFYRRLAEAAEAELMGPDEASCRQRLDRERGNLSAAAQWALDGADAETALAIGSRLQMFWFKNGHVLEGLNLLKAGLGILDPGEQAVRAEALGAMGFLAWISGDSQEARRWLGASLQLYGSMGNDGRVALSLLRLSNLDDPADIRRHRLEKALDIFRRLGDLRAVARALMNLGTLALEQAEYVEATGHLREAERVLAELGHDDETASTRNLLAWTAIGQGDLAGAESILRETLNEFRALGDKRGVGSSLHALGWVRLESRDWQGAIELMQEAAVQWRDGGLDGLLPYSLQGLACAAATGGHPERAALLFGAAAAGAGRLGTTLWEHEVLRGETSAAHAREAIGERRWQAAWAAGAGMSLAQAADLALR